MLGISRSKRQFYRFMLKAEADYSIIVLNTDSHYFYEINAMSSGKILMQMAINSKNITSDYRAICDAIQKVYPSKYNPSKADTDKWEYRVPFMTKPLNATGMRKEDVFKQRDHWLDEVKVFEKDLKQKLADNQ